MRPILRNPGSFGAIAAALLASGCGAGSDSTLDVVAIGEPASPFAAVGQLANPAGLLRGATVEGLVALDEQGRILPALADRWIVTDDGLSYIFRLRDGDWPGGGPIDAESARAALRQSLEGLEDTPLAADLAVIAEVKVMAARVIEVRLEAPQPDLLLLLAQPELGLAHKRRGAGPMLVTREGDRVTLTAMPPEKRGMPADEDWKDRTRKLRYRALPARQAIERFESGEAGLVLGGRLEHFPLADSFGLSRGAIQLDPVTGLFGLVAAHEDGFLSSASNREAIAMAIDRDHLLDDFPVGGWQATSRVVAPGLPGDGGTIGERWSGLDLARRRAVAAAAVARWRKGKGAAPHLRIAMPAGPGADKLFARIANDLRQAGLAADRVRPGDPADLRLIDSVALYPRAPWFLDRLGCAALDGPCSAAADKRLAEARAAPDAAARAALIAEAEAELTSANVFIPFGPPIRWSLVGGTVTGFAPNRLGYHPLMPLAMRPK